MLQLFWDETISRLIGWSTQSFNNISSQNAKNVLVLACEM